jgi:hypothetical protein
MTGGLVFAGASIALVAERVQRNLLQALHPSPRKALMQEFFLVEL